MQIVSDRQTVLSIIDSLCQPTPLEHYYFPQHILKQLLSPISISIYLPPSGAQGLSVCQEQASKGTQLGCSPGKYDPFGERNKSSGVISPLWLFCLLPFNRVVHYIYTCFLFERHFNSKGIHEVREEPWQLGALLRLWSLH